MAYGTVTKPSASFDRFVTVDLRRGPLDSLWARPDLSKEGSESKKLKLWQKLAFIAVLAAVSWVPFVLLYQLLG